LMCVFMYGPLCLLPSYFLCCRRRLFRALDSRISSTLYVLRSVMSMSNFSRRLRPCVLEVDNLNQGVRSQIEPIVHLLISQIIVVKLQDFLFTIICYDVVIIIL